jgi:3-oxoacid CoA-transferase subunit B
MAWTREQMAARAAHKLQDSFCVDLGIGIPTLAPNYIPEGIEMTLQSQNGIPGMCPFPFEGEEHVDLINAGRQTNTELLKCSHFSSADSFAMTRRGRYHLSILNAMRVSRSSDLANWMVPGKMVKGMGGAMDLVAGVKIGWLSSWSTRQGASRNCSKSARQPLIGLARHRLGRH